MWLWAKKIVQDNENTAHVVSAARERRSGNENTEKQKNTKWTVHEATIYRVVKIVTTRRAAPPSTFILLSRSVVYQVARRRKERRRAEKERREITSRGRAFRYYRRAHTARTYVNNIIFQCEKQGPERSCWKKYLVFVVAPREAKRQRKTSNQK